jgi:transposase-like protein
MAVSIAGKRYWLWRAVDGEGEVLDLLVQRTRNRAAAVKLMRKLLKKQGYAPDVLVTEKLRSYGAAKAQLGLSARHERGLRKNNRAENSHQPVRRRERNRDVGAQRQDVDRSLALREQVEQLDAVAVGQCLADLGEGVVELVLGGARTDGGGISHAAILLIV